MGKKDAKTALANGKNRTKQPYANQESQLFFNQKPITSPTAIQKTQKTPDEQQSVQKISLQSTTDILLAAILQELKTQNMIELIKLKTQEEQEQEELQAAKKMQELDEARFEEIKYSMYL